MGKDEAGIRHRRSQGTLRSDVALVPERHLARANTPSTPSRQIQGAACTNSTDGRTSRHHRRDGPPTQVGRACRRRHRILRWLPLRIPKLVPYVSCPIRRRTISHRVASDEPATH